MPRQPSQLCKANPCTQCIFTCIHTHMYILYTYTTVYILYRYTIHLYRYSRDRDRETETEIETSPMGSVSLVEPCQTPGLAGSYLCIKALSEGSILRSSLDVSTFSSLAASPRSGCLVKKMLPGLQENLSPGWLNSFPRWHGGTACRLSRLLGQGSPADQV